MTIKKPATTQRVTKRSKPVKRTTRKKISAKKTIPSTVRPSPIVLDSTPAVQPTTTPVNPIISAPTPSVSRYSLSQPTDPTRLVKVWLGVAAVMIVVLGIWTWSLRYTLFDVENRATVSNNSNFAELVGNIKNNLSTLQQQTNTVTNAPTTENLFSDLP